MLFTYCYLCNISLLHILYLDIINIQESVLRHACLFPDKTAAVTWPLCKLAFLNNVDPSVRCNVMCPPDQGQ